LWNDYTFGDPRVSLVVFLKQPITYLDEGS
jgi:hypothetical protein